MKSYYLYTVYEIFLLIFSYSIYFGTPLGISNIRFIKSISIIECLYSRNCGIEGDSFNALTYFFL